MKRFGITLFSLGMLSALLGCTTTKTDGPKGTEKPPEPGQKQKGPALIPRAPLRGATEAARTARVRYSTSHDEFSESWRQIVEPIERRWHNLVYKALDSITFDGEEVQLQFTLHHDGSISNLEVLHSGVSRFEETLAREAIESQAPFFEWTPDMIARMGEQTPLVFTFVY